RFFNASVCLARSALLIALYFSLKSLTAFTFFCKRFKTRACGSPNTFDSTACRLAIFKPSGCLKKLFWILLVVYAFFGVEATNRHVLKKTCTCYTGLNDYYESTGSRLRPTRGVLFLYP